MEPIVPTSEAIDEYGPFSYEGEDLLERLTALASTVQGQIPSCVGLSLSLLDLEVTFTLVATDGRVAALDAVQYLDGGPCVDAMETSSVVAFTAPRHPLTGDRWTMFSQASADNGIGSTLSLPLLRAGGVVGGFNLYASTAGAFEGQHEGLAQLLGAWAGGAVSDGDLQFKSRDVARRAPAILRGATRLIVARSLLQSAGNLTEREADTRLREASLRAGAPLADVVDTVIAVLGKQ